ncbi:LamG domain-containing protein [Novosphingobium panipatense]|uniref:Concanavalin A-like lectin/glucanases superfamily protein n=1 Tax=Novosphingobium panipatense TaxID=428991 RepID=A0ABY1QBU3_9SPHN|nr:LamG domain-containing protein [Novosphingobium panipatense]SMP66949.1 Concanavalin A-like lectin/glucanases superfamily protein [Novosphingobium panipatense]
MHRIPGMCVLALAALPASVQAKQETWNFDRLDRIGGISTQVIGSPVIEDGAIVFDGVDDALYLPRHPLAGARQFTVEAVFRPDGGAFEQRWLHLASDDPANQTRLLFEIRVTGQSWYLDSFIKGKGYSQVLIDPEKLHPIGRWYHVAQTFDGTMYRSYVNGVLESEAKVSGFTPQGPGNTSVGVRYNRVNFFRGAVCKVRFTDRALVPAKFIGASRMLSEKTPLSPSCGARKFGDRR